MEFKDRKFKMFDETWYIKYVDHAPLTPDQDEDAFNGGLISPTRRTIFISTKWPDGKPISKESVENSLRHELAHLILLSGQYLSCYNDEPLVEWIAKSLGILLKQHVI